MDGLVTRKLKLVVWECPMCQVRNLLLKHLLSYYVNLRKKGYTNNYGSKSNQSLKVIRLFFFFSEWVLEQHCFSGLKFSPVKHLDSMGTPQQLALLLCKPLQGAPAVVQLLKKADIPDFSYGADSDWSVVSKDKMGFKSWLLSCYLPQKLHRFISFLDSLSLGFIYTSAVKKGIAFFPKLVFQGGTVNHRVAIHVSCHRDYITTSETWVESVALVVRSYYVSLGAT